MSDLVLTMTPDVECLISENLRNWLADTVDFHGMFPKDDNVKVSTDHPFVALLQQQVPDGSKYDMTGFPSVTVMDTSSSKPVSMTVPPQTVKITPSIFDDIESGGRDQFIMSKESVETLRELLNGKDFIRAEGYTTVRKSDIAIEIWARNAVEKSKLFDLVTAYLVGHPRYELHSNRILINEGTISGERSGTYNLDFGEILYGGMIYFDVTYNVGIYTVKDYELITGATVNANNLVEEE